MAPRSQSVANCTVPPVARALLCAVSALVPTLFLAATLLLLICWPQSLAGQCRTAPENQHTHWAWNPVVIEQGKPLVIAKGQVVVLDTPRNVSFVPATGVLVEVFNHSELVRRGEWQRIREGIGQQRRAACISGDNGRFEFNLKPGEYELRLARLKVGRPRQSWSRLILAESASGCVYIWK